MVEMLESATILREATSRSFVSPAWSPRGKLHLTDTLQVIMDEVGRGTTPEDGIALAYACLHHLYHVNKCRSLFATHFHVLADMARQDMDEVSCLCTDVAQEADGSFSYIHRLKKGVNRQSHALKVARLAGKMLSGRCPVVTRPAPLTGCTGLPVAAVDVARAVLEEGCARREVPGLKNPSDIPTSFGTKTVEAAHE